MRVKVRMPAELLQAVERGAKSLKISRSQFVERAIREKLPTVEEIIRSGNPSAIAALNRGLTIIEELPRNATAQKLKATRRKLKRIGANVSPRKRRGRRAPTIRRPIVHSLATPVVADNPYALRNFWSRNVARAPWFDPQKEHVITVIFDTQFRAVAFSLVSVGSLNEALAHPREVLRPVIDHAGHAFAVMHNHPSGVPAPSTADHGMTHRLIESAELLQLRFLDHVIVGAGRDYFSFREVGIIAHSADSATAHEQEPKASDEQPEQACDPGLEMEDAVSTAGGLIEALSFLLELSSDGKYAPLSDKAVNGLRTLAFSQTEHLHRSFDDYFKSVQRDRGARK